MGCRGVLYVSGAPHLVIRLFLYFKVENEVDRLQTQLIKEQNKDVNQNISGKNARAHTPTRSNPHPCARAYTQTDRHRQTHTDRHTQTDTHRQTDTHTDRHTGRQTHRQINRQTDKQTDRQTERQTDKQRND